MRNLTIYGKATVVRSLAVSQLLYAFSKIAPPHSYLKKVEDEIVKFLWNGKKPKIKYKTLIGDLDQGGIRLPDIESILQANRACWAIKLMNSEGYWKCFTNMYFEKIGGITILGENFDASLLTKAAHFPNFYLEILKAWTGVSETKILTSDDISRQSIWFNKFINLNIEFVTIRSLFNKGIRLIHQVWEVGEKPNWNKIKQKGWSDKDYLTWRSIIDAIPADWKAKLREKSQSTNSEVNLIKCVSISEKRIPLHKVNSKMFYWKLIKRKVKKPTSQIYISAKLGDAGIDWTSVYSRLYKSTIDTKLRAFQFKILNNCLYLNQKLYMFKLVDSPKCNFCFNQNETIEHLFVECCETKTFYLKCKNWLKLTQVNLPELNFKNALLGYEGDSFEIFFVGIDQVYALYGKK